jgi:hypothetical protein
LQIKAGKAVEAARLTKPDQMIRSEDTLKELGVIK